MYSHLLVAVVGLVVLGLSADRFVLGAAAASQNLGVGPLIVGITVVGFGTSAPELAISTFAALQGKPGIAIGNAIGSNIANISLVLGLTVLVIPLLARSRLLRQNMFMLLGVTVATPILLLDGRLGRADGSQLIAGLLVSMGAIVWMASRLRGDPMSREFAHELPRHMPTTRAAAMLLLGLLGLLIGSRLTVWGAVSIARDLGLSDLIIGLTIVAVGTSLPELATAITSGRHKQYDIVIGNIIGSNLFNLLGVLGVCGLLYPAALPAQVLSRDYPTMALLTLALALLLGRARKMRAIDRVSGGLLIGVFVAYQTMIYLDATS
ncbi:MAG: calcium/sodium antiporter [Gammaproteobacteria bacterium]